MLSLLKYQREKKSVHMWLTLCCIFVTVVYVWAKFRIQNKKDAQKNSYERRVYESVDYSSPS